MKQLHFLLLFGLLIACAEEVVEKPENLLAKEKMVNIYYDLAVLGGIKSVSPDALKKKGIEAMPYIYKKYDIDSLQFFQSDLYYASIPLDYQTMYEEVETRLEEQRSGYEEARKKRSDSIKEANKKRSDSIRMAKKNEPKPVLSKTDGNSKQ